MSKEFPKVDYKTKYEALQQAIIKTLYRDTICHWMSQRQVDVEIVDTIAMRKLRDKVLNDISKGV